jgi:indole-3-glycerol phosphate synthase
MNTGATAVSVLTDKNFFQGDIRFLKDIAGIKSVPLLRKDFMIDEYQIFEAKSNGSDFILLISEILSANQLKELTHAAFENDLEVLLELHSEDELSKIDFSLNKIIGINNRDLKDFSVDLNTSISIAEKLPEDIIVVSESGISEKDDLERIKDSPVRAILVGEHLMKAGKIEDKLKQLIEWCYRES